MTLTSNDFLRKLKVESVLYWLFRD